MDCAVLHQGVIYGLCSVTSECYLWTVQCYIGVLIMDCAVLHRSVIYGLAVLNRSVNYGLYSVKSEC